MKWNYYDLDNMIRLPLEVINSICINGNRAFVRYSVSSHGFHVRTSFPCAACKKYSDPKYELLKELLGFQILFSSRGKKEAGEWWIIRDFGVYAE